jgi:hypothetical protein
MYHVAMRSLILLFLLAPIGVRAQTTFAPPGAQWTYVMSSTLIGWPTPPQWTNQVSVSGDTLLLGRNGSVLTFGSTTFYYPFMMGNGNESTVVLATSGDTVLLYTPYDSSFHPLMIFDAAPGDTWKIPISFGPVGWPSPLHDTITYTALGCDTLWYEGIPLRRMEYGYSSLLMLYSGSGAPHHFVERIGDLQYLFPWEPYMGSDFDVFDHLLCYSDSELVWPTVGVTCDVLLEAPALYSQPTGGLASVEVQDGVLVVSAPDNGQHYVHIMDVLGRTRHAAPLPPGTTRITLNESGILLITVRNEQGERHTIRARGF